MLSIFSRLRRQETTARPVIPPETKASLSLSVIWVETKIKGSLRSWQDKRECCSFVAAEPHDDIEDWEQVKYPGYKNPGGFTG